MNASDVLQKLSEVIDVSEASPTYLQLIEVYNALAADTITPCAVRNESTIQCGERAIKICCYKSRSLLINWTLYIGVCETHLSVLTDLDSTLEISITRFVTGDKLRCEQLPYSASSDGG